MRIIIIGLHLQSCVFRTVIEKESGLAPADPDLVINFLPSAGRYPGME